MRIRASNPNIKKWIFLNNIRPFRLIFAWGEDDQMSVTFLQKEAKWMKTLTNFFLDFSF